MPLIVGIAMENESLIISGDANFLSIDVNLFQGTWVGDDEFSDIFGFELGSPILIQNIESRVDPMLPQP